MTWAPCSRNAVAKAPPMAPVPPLISTCFPATLKSGLMDILRSWVLGRLTVSASPGSGSQWLFIGEISGGVEPIAFLTP